MNNYYLGTYLVLGRSEAYAMPFDASLPGDGQWLPITKDGIDYSFSTSTRGLIPASDINGDGFADVLFEDFDNLHIVFGSASGLPAVIDASSLNGCNGFSIVGDVYEDEADRADTRCILDYLSRMVGDINGDRLDDLLLGSPQTYVPVLNLDDLIDCPYPFGDSDQTGIVRRGFWKARGW